ncbi:MAG: ADP-forming succinate--CoA ligase subunit beta [Dehalococcoidia bacterium]|nr:ADP-forming succinate--CoA ligase subunit beta [Dehalococcoidia bacterium]
MHEYQAKELLASFSIPVPGGKVAADAAGARGAAAHLGGNVVIKAQVYAGGRGKAGGIKQASSPEEAGKAAASLLGSRLVTHQTGAEGVPVEQVLVEEAVNTERELYLGIVIDSSRRLPVIMASEAGGMDIEEIALKSPEKIIKTWVDPVAGFQPFQGRQIAYGLNLQPELVKPAGELVGNLFRLFKTLDCSLVEINPLVVTMDKRLLALDAKVNFDDNALFRHPEIAAMNDKGQVDPLEVRAQDFGIKNYIKMEGDIGCMVNGAGLAMSVLDLLTLCGGKPANFLDIGTANNTERVVNAFRLFNSDPAVKAILVNIFGGMARVDVIARGIVEAYSQMDIRVPTVVRLAGTNVQEGECILEESGLKIIRAYGMQEAAEKAVAAVKNR